MRAVIKAVLAGTLLAGSSLAATAPAEARDTTGTAILAGVIGLGIGAAIASDHHRYADSRYDRGYAPTYYGGGYGYSTGYGGSPAYGYNYGYQRGHDRYDRRDRNRGWDGERYDRHDDYRDYRGR